MKTFQQVHLLMTLVNLLIKVKNEDFTLLSEQFALEATTIQIRWQLQRPELHNGSGDCVKVAMKSGLFTGLNYTKTKFSPANMKLGELIGLSESESKLILMGFHAHRTYGKSDMMVTPHDVAYVLLSNLYDSNRFESIEYSDASGLAKLEISGGSELNQYESDTIKHLIQGRRALKVNFGFKGAHCD